MCSIFTYKCTKMSTGFGPQWWNHGWILFPFALSYLAYLEFLIFSIDHYITWTTRKIRSLVSTKERTRLWHQKRTEFEHWSSFTKSMTTFILLRLFSYWENEELIPHILAPFLLFSLNTTTHTHIYMHTYPNSTEKCWERIHFTSIFNVWRRVYLFKG